MKCPAFVRVLATLTAAACASSALADDIVLTPPAGGAVTVTDTGSGTTRFRIADDGTVTLTGPIFLGANRFINAHGNSNAFVGVQAGNLTMTSGLNTAVGFRAFEANASGYQNVVVGGNALRANTSGFENTAVGINALLSNTTGSSNTALGEYALRDNTTGDFNLGVGRFAGTSWTTGDNNIAIGNNGVAAESNTMRIGSASQTRTFISAIRGVTTGSANAIPVMIDSNGQLGTVSSSARFKDDIADMESATDALMQLRPVTFHYKADQDPEGRTIQYGLVAEEVAQVYPGLVARTPDGQVETVMYQFLPSMLLNEFQKQQRTIGEQAAEVKALRAEMGEIRRLLGRQP